MKKSGRIGAQLLHEVDTRIPLTAVREAAGGTAEAGKGSGPFVRSVAPNTPANSQAEVFRIVPVRLHGSGRRRRNAVLARPSSGKGTVHFAEESERQDLVRRERRVVSSDIQSWVFPHIVWRFMALRPQIVGFVMDADCADVPSCRSVVPQLVV